MDENVTPMQCGLRWTVDFGDPGRDFIGRAALAQQQVDTRFVGLQLSQRGIMRAGQRVRTGHGDGVITSGTFSPTLGRSIAMARIPAEPDLTAEVDVRGRWLAADIVDLPFVRPQRGGAS
jgi:aminomethyltransferase